MHTEFCALLVYALSGMLRHQAASDRALRLGPELFPDGPARAVAALILTGRRHWLDSLTPAEQREAGQLGQAVLRCTVPGEDAVWALHLVGLLAEVRFVPLLVQTLRWAEDRAEAGIPLHHIRQCLDRVFRVALGEDDRTSSVLLSDDAMEVAA